ncbi:MerR family transcriptional regulator [Candidimonas sp. SYP-B2681]|uniref:MerR family transcriptional regulator n=1 Tax=Candidimonas sp. SYP-B2681 TaxID=2497686 RepID=UPI000F87A9E8|nr:MerR family transcriptional regulator [Candidimonas sp. SYP-B2681]RTZ41493.1 MerR family transcriptional regulator [Candidimonas sp. SYP-B2681]
MEKIETTPEDSHISYRSGVAARLAGLSTETLRVWERRYNLSDTERSARGQRLYSAEQVRRLGLLKQLVDQGHAISTLASLPDEQLQQLIAAPVKEQQAAGPLRVAVISGSLARRIAAGGRDEQDIIVQCSCSTLEQAASLPPDAKAQVLLIELSELHESALPLIMSARDACGGAAVVVLYRFGASATIRALRAQGCLVGRIPAELSELMMLCRSALAGERLPPPQQPAIPKLRFDEDALFTITAAGSGLACECPKHLADVLLMVGSFERYSAQCASRNADDAQLHHDLEHAAGHARAILEAAMERLARADGLPLPSPL